VRVQMIDGVDSSVNRAGEIFHASLAAPIVVDNQIVVPAGTDVYVKLTNAKSAGHLTGQSTLALELVRMEFQGKSYALASNDYTQTGSSRGKRTAETVGGGAVLGTLLGAVDRRRKRRRDWCGDRSGSRRSGPRCDQGSASQDSVGNEAGLFARATGRGQLFPRKESLSTTLAQVYGARQCLALLGRQEFQAK